MLVLTALFQPPLMSDSAFLGSYQHTEMKLTECGSKTNYDCLHSVCGCRDAQAHTAHVCMHVHRHRCACMQRLYILFLDGLSLNLKTASLLSLAE